MDLVVLLRTLASTRVGSKQGHLWSLWCPLPSVVSGKETVVIIYISFILYLAVDVYIRHVWISQMQFGRSQTGVDRFGCPLQFWIVTLILFPDKLSADGHSVVFLRSQVTSSYGGPSRTRCKRSSRQKRMRWIEKVTRTPFLQKMV